jgi:hypothetical protein
LRRGSSPDGQAAGSLQVRLASLVRCHGRCVVSREGSALCVVRNW